MVEVCCLEEIFGVCLEEIFWVSLGEIFEVCLEEIFEVFCLEDECSLEGVEKEVFCSDDCLFEPRLATFIASSISRRQDSLAIGGGVDGVLDDAAKVALRRLLLGWSDIFLNNGAEFW